MLFPPLPQSVPGQSRQVERPPKTAPDIALLTSRLSRGDESAYAEFYELYFNRLLRYLLVLTAGREDAAREALQATMLRIARNARRFEAGDAFWSWLTVLARSSVVDAERKRKRYLALLDRFFQNAPAPAANTDADSRLLHLLEHKLDELSTEDRALIERKYFDGAAVAEIAKEIGATEKTVESRLVRIRRQLRNSITMELKHE